jgi:hypothetical protein
MDVRQFYGFEAANWHVTAQPHVLQYGDRAWSVTTCGGGEKEQNVRGVVLRSRGKRWLMAYPLWWRCNIYTVGEIPKRTT